MTAAGDSPLQDGAAPEKARIVVTDATESDAEALAVFFRLAWHSDGTTASVRSWMRRAAAANVVEPGRFPPTVVARIGQRVIGYCSSLPLRLWDGRQEQPAYWAKGLMVLPEHRNGPIGFHVLKALSQRLPLSAAVTVHPASKRLFAAAGYADLGAIPNYICPIAPGRLMSRVDLDRLPLERVPRWMKRAGALSQRAGIARLLGAPAGLAVRYFFLRRSGEFDVDVWGKDAPSREALDQLWRRVRGGVASGPVRDGRALLDRYASGEEARRYRFVTVSEARDLVGVCIVRVPGASGDPRLGGARVAAIADWVFPPDRRDIGVAALRAGARLAAALGADAALLSASHTAVARLARSAGFFSVPGNIHFFLRTGATPIDGWSSSLDGWWLSRGDGESDAAF